MISHSLCNLLGLCWFSGGHRLGYFAVCWWNAHKDVSMSMSYFSVSSVFSFEFFWTKKDLFSLVFSYWRGRLWANFHRGVFRSAFVQNFARSLFRPRTSRKLGFYTIDVVVDVRRTLLPLMSFLERFVSFCASFKSSEVSDEEFGWWPLSGGWNGRQICFCPCCIGNLRRSVREGVHLSNFNRAKIK